MKTTSRHRRQRRIRARLSGTAERPRASVFRSAAAISLQLIDDTAGRTLLTVRVAGGDKGKIDAAIRCGKQAGEALLAQGITAAVFDRGGYRYHGRVKAVAEGLREAGVNV
jgi:large subunit ribosomal protein L18